MEFVQWLRMTSLSMAIQNQSYWLWPMCESLHFVGLSLLVGLTGFFDVRLLGFVRRVPLKAAWKLIPWATAGFAINLLTGIIFLIGVPQQYYNNISWWFKVLFLFVAGVNAVVFQLTMADKVDTIRAGDDTPTSFKVAGAVSLIAWFAVLYFGRMMPFIDASTAAGL